MTKIILEGVEAMKMQIASLPEWLNDIVDQKFKVNEAVRLDKGKTPNPSVKQEIYSKRL